MSHHTDAHIATHHVRACGRGKAHGHGHGLVDPSITRSRAGLRVVGASLAVLAVTALVQATIYLATDSIALLADLIHNGGDALTAVPLGAAFLLRSQRAERGAGIAVARMLLRAGREHRSLVLEADGRHLMTDVWTSIGVVAGVALVAVTGWQRLDPLIALLVAGNIIITGTSLIRRFTGGLMDRALPPEQRAAIEAVLQRQASDRVQFHALRTRSAGPRAFRSRPRRLDRTTRPRRRRAHRGRPPGRPAAGNDLHPPRAARGRHLLRRHRARPPRVAHGMTTRFSSRIRPRSARGRRRPARARRPPRADRPGPAGGGRRSRRRRASRHPVAERELQARPVARQAQPQGRRDRPAPGAGAQHGAGTGMAVAGLDAQVGHAQDDRVGDRDPGTAERPAAPVIARRAHVIARTG